MSPFNNPGLGSDRSPLNRRRELSPNAPGWRSTRRICDDPKKLRKRTSDVLKMRLRRTWQMCASVSPPTGLYHNYSLTSDKIHRILDANGEVNLFKFIINPNDFAQSVENLFYLSFLIRDGSCSLEVESGEPVICTCSMYLDQAHDTTRNS